MPEQSELVREFDAERAPTRLQLRVLRVLWAIGPCSFDELASQFQRPRPALRAALHWLRLGGWVFRPSEKRWDVTAAARQWLRSNREAAYDRAS